MTKEPINLIDNKTYSKEDVSLEIWDTLKRLYALPYDEKNSVRLLLQEKAEEPIRPIEGSGFNKLRTTNFVGYLQIDGQRVSILSRFANPGESNLEGDFFLDYMLEKVAPGISLRDMQPIQNSNEGISGTLLDCAALWESYLAILLDNDFVHTDSANKKGGQHLFSLNGKKVFQIYPDFISRQKPRVIADAKYKVMEFEKRTRPDKSETKQGKTHRIGETDRLDFFQVLAYMERFKSNKGFLLYPRSKKQRYLWFNLLEGVSGLDDSVKTSDKSLIKLGMGVPNQNDYANYGAFEIDMSKREKKFIKKIRKLMNASASSEV